MLIVRRSKIVLSELEVIPWNWVNSHHFQGMVGGTGSRQIQLHAEQGYKPAFTNVSPERNLLSKQDFAFGQGRVNLRKGAQGLFELHYPTNPDDRGEVLLVTFCGNSLPYTKIFPVGAKIIALVPNRKLRSVHVAAQLLSPLGYLWAPVQVGSTPRFEVFGRVDQMVLNEHEFLDWQKWGFLSEKEKSGQKN